MRYRKFLFETPETDEILPFTLCKVNRAHCVSKLIYDSDGELKLITDFGDNQPQITEDATIIAYILGIPEKLNSRTATIVTEN